MDSITQATLGALCGELILAKKIGNKGIYWGLLFGTLPDLDILAYPLLSASEQLGWHRGISHSILSIFVATTLFGWLLHTLYKERHINLTFPRTAAFVFLAWSTHILIDCFNTYGTMILEPFSSQRIAINNIFIIDLFFLIPIIIGLTLAMAIGRKNYRKRFKITTITFAWLTTYFIASLVIKQLANNHFQQLLASKGINQKELMTAPTFSNIFLWRMVAQDADGETFHISYWSLLDKKEEPPLILSFKKEHHLEKNFKESEDLKAITNFTGGWHKTFIHPQQPNSIYIAALKIGEMQIPHKDYQELRPAFIWVVTKNNDGSYSQSRPFKRSKDGFKHLTAAAASTLKRATGNTDQWMKGNNVWSWDTFAQLKNTPQTE